MFMGIFRTDNIPREDIVKLVDAFPGQSIGKHPSHINGVHCFLRLLVCDNEIKLIFIFYDCSELDINFDLVVSCW